MTSSESLEEVAGARAEELLELISRRDSAGIGRLLAGMPGVDVVAVAIALGAGYLDLEYENHVLEGRMLALGSENGRLRATGKALQQRCRELDGHRRFLQDVVDQHANGIPKGARKVKVKDG